MKTEKFYTFTEQNTLLTKKKPKRPSFKKESFVKLLIPVFLKTHYYDIIQYVEFNFWLLMNFILIFFTTGRFTKIFKINFSGYKIIS